MKKIIFVIIFIGFMLWAFPSFSGQPVTIDNFKELVQLMNTGLVIEIGSSVNLKILEGINICVAMVSFISGLCVAFFVHLKGIF